MRVQGARSLLPLVALILAVGGLAWLSRPGARGPAEDPGEGGSPPAPAPVGEPPAVRVDPPSAPAPARPASIAGILEGDPEPLGEGAWVALTGLPEARRAAVDAKGRFRFDDVPAGERLSLWLGPDPDGSRVHELVSDLVLEPGEERVLAFRVPSHAAIRGRVLDEDRRPLEGVRVAVLPPDLDWRQSVPVAATTGRGGWFYVSLDPEDPPERLRLVVDHVREGYVLKERVIDTRTAGSRLDVVVTLHLGHAIEGVLLGPSHDPIAGAVVHLLEDYEGDPAARRPAEGRVVTDEDGRFRDDAYRPGTYRVVATGELDGRPFAVVKEGVPAGTKDLRLQFRGFGSFTAAFECATTGRRLVPDRVDLFLAYSRIGEPGENTVRWETPEAAQEMEFNLVPEGYYLLRVRLSGYRDLVTDVVYVPPGVRLGRTVYRLRPL